jgi:hypothetical protein
MRRIIRKIGRPRRTLKAAIVLACVTVAGCDTLNVGGPPVTTPTPVPTAFPSPPSPSLAISPTSATLGVGDQRTIVAATGGVTSPFITFLSLSPTVAAVDALKGVVTCVTPGTTTITASEHTTPLSAVATVTCTGAPGVTPTAYNVVLTVVSDPQGNDALVLLGTVTQIICVRVGSTLIAAGPEPWIGMSGTMNPNGTFILTGSGPSGKQPAVGARWNGSAQGLLVSGQVEVQMPNGPVTYSLSGTAR